MTKIVKENIDADIRALGGLKIEEFDSEHGERHMSFNFPTFGMRINGNYIFEMLVVHGSADDSNEDLQDELLWKLAKSLKIGNMTGIRSDVSNKIMPDWTIEGQYRVKALLDDLDKQGFHAFVASDRELHMTKDLKTGLLTMDFDRAAIKPQDLVKIEPLVMMGFSPSTQNYTIL